MTTKQMMLVLLLPLLIQCGVMQCAVAGSPSKTAAEQQQELMYAGSELDTLYASEVSANASIAKVFEQCNLCFHWNQCWRCLFQTAKAVNSAEARSLSQLPAHCCYLYC
jgi:hypothetical protein